MAQIDWAMGHQKSKNTREVQATSTLSLACDEHMSEYPTIRPGDHRKIGSKDNFRVADNSFGTHRGLAISALVLKTSKVSESRGLHEAGLYGLGR
jgi:hypothetical protein